MRPTTSCPGTRGQLIGKRASTVPESEWQTPHASTRMRTWPGPGSTSGFITASNSPGFVTWIALYIALISPPLCSEDSRRNDRIVLPIAQPRPPLTFLREQGAGQLQNVDFIEGGEWEHEFLAAAREKRRTARRPRHSAAASRCLRFSRWRRRQGSDLSWRLLKTARAYAKEARRYLTLSRCHTTS